MRSALETLLVAEVVRQSLESTVCKSPSQLQAGISSEVFIGTADWVSGNSEPNHPGERASQS